jgi:hypothetical protein
MAGIRTQDIQRIFKEKAEQGATAILKDNGMFGSKTQVVGLAKKFPEIKVSDRLLATPDLQANSSEEKPSRD